MPEQIEYFVGCYRKGRPKFLGRVAYFESDNPILVLSEYEKYKEIFNPDTTSIELGVIRKKREALSQEGLAIAIEKAQQLDKETARVVSSTVMGQ
jgi:hypothetical protein